MSKKSESVTLSVTPSTSTSSVTVAAVTTSESVTPSTSSSSVTKAELETASKTTTNV